MKVTMGVEYVTRGIETPVRLLCTDGPGNEPVIGILNGSIETWHADGRYIDCESSLDLIQSSPTPLEAAARRTIEESSSALSWLSAAIQCGDFKWDEDQRTAARGCHADMRKAIDALAAALEKP